MFDLDIVADKFPDKESFLNYLKSNMDALNSEQAEVVARFIEGEAIGVARENYYAYVKLMGPVLMGEFVDGRHIEKIAKELQKAAEAAVKKGHSRYKLKVHLPPGSSKTQLCSRMFGSWVLGRWPWVKLLICTHGLIFGRDEIGMKMLDIMRTDEYKKIFPEVELREDKQTAGRFITTAGGEMYVTSLSAGTSGRRGTIIISDDPVVEGDALSKDVKDRKNSEYTTNIRTRFQPGFNCAEILVGTKWAQGDIFQYVEDVDKNSKDPWKIINVPALLTQEASKELRRKGDPEDVYLEGTSYWPEMYTTAQLVDVKQSMRHDMARWNALYMQTPTPEEGAIIKPEDFRIWKEERPPAYHTKVLVLDTAYTKDKQSDPSAYALFGIFNHTEGSHTKPNIILLDRNKGKWDFPELIEKVEGINQRKNPDYILVEYRASGIALHDELRRRGLPMVSWKTQKDKLARAHSVAPLMRSGIFWVPMPEGYDDIAHKSLDYINTICNLSSWDELDVLTCLLMYLRENNLLLGDNYAVSQEEFYGDDEDDRRPFKTYSQALL